MLYGVKRRVLVIKIMDALSMLRLFRKSGQVGSSLMECRKSNHQLTRSLARVSSTKHSLILYARICKYAYVKLKLDGKMRLTTIGLR